MWWFPLFANSTKILHNFFIIYYFIQGALRESLCDGEWNHQQGAVCRDIDHQLLTTNFAAAKSKLAALASFRAAGDWNKALKSSG